jgi:pyridoxamine 5'-phosphate oxidase
MQSEIFDIYGGDPVALFRQWLAQAQESEINDAEAFCLATSDARGMPSARMVLLKDIDARGIKFHTNADSRKGRDMEENPHAALCMHWKSTRKQIRAEGKIMRVSAEESDAYFSSRPRARQIGAWASRQSRPYEKQDDLFRAVQAVEERFSGEDNIPRPPQWIGYRLVPERIEFWTGHEDRLHTRFEYIRSGQENDAAAWDAHWLYP